MKALVIDDSKAIRTILCRFLTELGFETVQAATGGEGLRAIRETPGLDVALVDWNLPEMSGYDIVCEVRKDKALDAVRIIMVTTESELNQVQKALAAGANEYAMKPFTKEIIADKILLAGVKVAG